MNIHRGETFIGYNNLKINLSMSIKDLSATDMKFMKAGLQTGCSFFMN